MPSNPQIPLVQATVRVDLTLCDIESPQDILDLVAENMVADSQAVLAAINSGIVFSPNPPTGDNFGKLWVKTTGGGSTDPRGIGIVINGSYTIIPIPADQDLLLGVPSGGIIIWPGDSAPEGWQIYAGTPPVGSSYIQRL